MLYRVAVLVLGPFLYFKEPSRLVSSLVNIVTL
jgi:hypothetical protein